MWDAPGILKTVLCAEPELATRFAAHIARCEERFGDIATERAAAERERMLKLTGPVPRLEHVDGGVCAQCRKSFEGGTLILADSTSDPAFGDSSRLELRRYHLGCVKPLNEGWETALAENSASHEFEKYLEAQGLTKSR